MSAQFIDNAVFEITDYTTASNWERFIALIEEVLTQWDLNKKDSDARQKNLSKGDIYNGTWHENREVLRYGDSAFDIRLLYLQVDNQVNEEDVDIKEKSTRTKRNADTDIDEDNIKYSDNRLPDTLPDCLRDLISTENDFAPRAHCLVRWLGLRHLIILSPKGDTIISENRFKLILSSASIALSNVNCHVPIFVQIHNPKSNFYQGISEHSNIRTMYEMYLQKKNDKQYRCLSDLISLFREKISASLNDAISVTVKLNYCVNEFKGFQLPENHDQYGEFQKVLQELMPKKEADKVVRDQGFYGPNSTFDEVLEAMKSCNPYNRQILLSLQLGVIWLPRSDKVIIDTQVHSDLDPAEAPIWTLRCVARHCGPMSIVYQTLTLSKLFNDAIDYCYTSLDGKVQFDNESPNSLKKSCLELSYKLSREPEVVISESQSDNIRKLVAIIFYLAHNKSVNENDGGGGIEDIVKSLKHLSKTDLNEIYRNFGTLNTPWIKEYILRTQISRPFIPAISSPLPQRMFCTISNEEFRLCGAFSELCS